MSSLQLSSLSEAILRSMLLKLPTFIQRIKSHRHDSSKNCISPEKSPTTNYNIYRYQKALGEKPSMHANYAIILSHTILNIFISSLIDTYRLFEIYYLNYSITVWAPLRRCMLVIWSASTKNGGSVNEKNKIYINILNYYSRNLFFVRFFFRTGSLFEMF